MNHKWTDNKCKVCGVERQKKEFKRWQRSETVLVNGVWQDRNIHTYGTAWHYGTEHKFERPDCVGNELCEYCGYLKPDHEERCIQKNK